MRYLLAELRHRTGHVLGTLTGVTLGVALFIALTAAGDGFQEAARQPLAGVDADVLISRPAAQTGTAAQATRGVRQPFGLAPLTLAEAEALRTVPGVVEASGGLLLWDFGPSSYQTLLGVDVSAGDIGPAQAGEWVVAGRFFEPGEREVAVVDRHYAAFFGLQPGSALELGGQAFTVIGIVEIPGGNQAASANFYLPLPDAQALAGLPADEINQIYLRVDEMSEVDAVAAASEIHLGEISALTEQSIVQVMGGIAQVSDRFAGVAALTALLGGLILTGVTLSASIRLRTREIGVMKATGWQARDVVRLFIMEGVAFSLLGAVLGILLGWLATLLLGQISVDYALLASTTPDFGAGPEAAANRLPAHLSASAALIASLAAVSGGGLASWRAARQSARRKPADALRET